LSTTNFATIDTVIFIAYCLIIIGIGLWVSRDKKGHQKNAEDYFLAGKSLPWWAIGASLIAANISAEQFIGMSGSGFAIGLAIASYEWMAALTLIVVGKFFLPIFIEKKLYTIPEFIEKRFSTQLKTILAIFWIALFVFVNLTTVMFLGAKALDTIIGTGDGSFLMHGIIGLALFAAAYSLWGGLSAVAWTDVVQVVLLIFGGLLTTFIALQQVSPDGTVLGGFAEIYQRVPEKFSMILSKGEVITPDGKDAWGDLPGIAVIVGGMWIANLYYWGFNQYIIQRTLAAKSLRESQKGIAFAAILKLIIPLVVVIPGIVAYVMNLDDTGQLAKTSLDAGFVANDGTIASDNASPWLIKQYIGPGLKGLVVAALAAAIVSSLASMLNSTATIFTMDIYRPYINPNANDRQTVNVGRLTAAAALVVAILLAPQLASLGQVFQFIQEYTGVVSPGILAVFITGLFWKKATNKAAIIGIVASIPIALVLKLVVVGMPFMHQMGITFLGTLAVIVLLSHVEGKGADNAKGINLMPGLFKTDSTFNLLAIAVMLVLVVLYAAFW